MFGLRYKHWTCWEAFAYVLKGVARELKVAPAFWENNYHRAFKKRWLVREGNVSCLDIKGAERDMLRGATNVLKTFAPKLAICTYHLPDDPEVLEQIIKEANPKYKVVHIRKKLFAAVI
jgi:hypothetical protein